MAGNLFSIPIFFIVFRETLEAAIIVSVLLGLVEQIVLGNNDDAVDVPQRPPHDALPVHQISPPEPSCNDDANGHEKHSTPDTTPRESSPTPTGLVVPQENVISNKRLIRKLRLQIFLGALAGFLISFAVGAAFIAVWFTQAADLWAKSENLFEGIFSLIASILIFIMGVTMLKMDRAKAKWKVKLQQTFDGNNANSSTLTGKWALFLLPFITLLREGMEAVVFVGGVTLGQPATSIPIAAIVGIICGLVVGYIIYAFSSRTSLSLFLIVMTNFLLLIGAGLFSKGVGFIEKNAFTDFLGGASDDLGGDGPGSYNVVGNVWHLNCCNPENKFDPQGWNIFAALFGWTNSATLGTVLSYVFYWIAVMLTIVFLKWREGRTTFMGHESPAGKERRIKRESRERNEAQV